MVLSYCQIIQLWRYRHAVVMKNVLCQLLFRIGLPDKLMVFVIIHSVIGYLVIGPAMYTRIHLVPEAIQAILTTLPLNLAKWPSLLSGT